MRLVITGSRDGHPDVRKWLIAWNKRHGAPEMCIVGDATGVDWEAMDVASKLGWHVVRVRVNPLLKSPWCYHERNERMVAWGRPGDTCLAFPSSGSRGTHHCAGLAKKAGLTVHYARVPTPA